MAQRHHVTMEVGGWVLLVAALAWLLYLLFHKSTNGGTVVQSNIITGTGVVPTQPAIRPSDPTRVSTYTDPGGHLWTWDPTGQQWAVSGKVTAAPPDSSGLVNQVPTGLPNDLTGLGIINGGILNYRPGGTGNCPCGDVDPTTGELCPCPPDKVV